MVKRVTLNLRMLCKSCPVVNEAQTVTMVIIIYSNASYAFQSEDQVRDSRRFTPGLQPSLSCAFLHQEYDDRVNDIQGARLLRRYMPDVFKAISPHYAFRYFFSAGQASWVSLNGILLCVSGSEALFADMGHFSHRAITVSLRLSHSFKTACTE